MTKLKQAVILAAGKGTRLEPLTLTRPKALLSAGNKTILEHNLEQINDLVEEAIIVIGPFKKMIQEKIGSEFQGLKISYVEQSKAEGPGQALQVCRDLLQDKFLVLNGDDFYSGKDLERMLAHKYCVLAQEVEKPELFGAFEVEGDLVKGFEEKPKQPKSNLVNAGAYLFDEKVFEFELKKTERNEFEITDYLKFLVSENEELCFEKVEDYWLPIVFPWSLLEANEFFVRNLKENRIEGEIEDNVIIKGKLVLGKGSRILSGTYIDGNCLIGENSTIGPNVVIRGHRGGVSIGSNCGISNTTDLMNSIIMDGVKAKHFSYIGDSVIGENCNLGAGTIIANLRHDKASVKMIIKGEKIDSGRKKLGIIMGDNCKTGINTSFYPGRKIGPNQGTLPGEIVREDRLQALL